MADENPGGAARSSRMARFAMPGVQCLVGGAGAALQQGSVTVLLPPTPHTNPLCG